MIAQLDDIVSDSPPRQAVLQLLELADQYQRHSKWDYYESVLMQILESFPQEPLSSAASVRLIQFWSSQELNLRRSQVRQAGGVKRSTNPNQIQNNFNQILQTNNETPDLFSGGSFACGWSSRFESAFEFRFRTRSARVEYHLATAGAFDVRTFNENRARSCSQPASATAFGIAASSTGCQAGIGCDFPEIINRQ